MPMFPTDLPFPFILSCSGHTRERFSLNNCSPEYSDRKGWKFEEKSEIHWNMPMLVRWGPSP